MRYLIESGSWGLVHEHCYDEISIGPDVEAMVQSPLNAIVIFHFTSLLLFISLHFEVLLDTQVIFCFLKYTLWAGPPFGS